MVMHKALCAAALVVMALPCGVAHGGAERHADPLGGIYFSYDAKKWGVMEGLGGRRAILTPRRANSEVNRIVVTEGADVANVRHDYAGAKMGDMREERIGPYRAKVETFSFVDDAVPMKGAVFELNPADTRYRVDCIAEAHAFARAYFSCRNFVANIGEDASLYEGVVDRAIRLLLRGEDECAGAARRVRRAAASSVTIIEKERLHIIADMLEGKASAATGAHKLVERSGAAIDYLILSLAQRDNAEIAQRLAQRAYDIDPTSINSYWLGFTQWQLGREGIAREHFLKACRDSPSELSLAMLIRMELEKGDVDAARRWWKKMETPSLVKSVMTVKLARLDGALADAIAIYDSTESLLCGTLGAQAATDAGLAAGELGGQERAAQLFKRAIAWDSDYTRAYKALANIALYDGGDGNEVAALLASYAKKSRDPKEREQVRRIIDELTSP